MSQGNCQTCQSCQSHQTWQTKLKIERDNQW